MGCATQGEQRLHVVPFVSWARDPLRAKASPGREKTTASSGIVATPGRDGWDRRESVMVMTLPEPDSEFAPPPEPEPDLSGPPIPLMRPTIGDDAVAAAAAVMRTGWMAEGPAVNAFEDALADLVGAEHAVALANGTSPLHLVLLVLGVRPGDDVVVPACSQATPTSAGLY